MIFAPIPGWLVIAVLVCILGYFLIKVAFYAIMALIAILMFIFGGKHKLDAHEVHLMYHPEDRFK